MSALTTPRAGAPYTDAPPPGRRDPDDADVRALLRSRSMSGMIQVAMTREPDARIAAGVEGMRHARFLVRDTQGRLVGMGTRSTRPVFVGGAPVLQGYLGQLRSVPGACGFKRLRSGFATLERARKPDELDYDLTAIVADNEPARRLLERGLPGLPTYHALADMESLVMTTRRPPPWRRRAELRFRRAARGDMPQVLDLLRSHNSQYGFASDWTLEDLTARGRCRGLRPEHFRLLWDGGELVACGAVWDQRAFKQARVQGYAPWLRASRHLVNAGLTLAGQPALPKPGSELAMGYVSHLATRDPSMVVPLIESLRSQARNRGLAQLTVAFDRRDPRCGAVTRALGPRPYISRLYAVAWPESQPPLEQLRATLTQVEVATL